MTRRLDGRKAGFTFVEVLLVIAVVATLGSAGYVAVVSTKTAASSQKLQSDVDALNRAIKLHEANGGTLPTTEDPNAVLAQLKVRSDGLDVAQDTSMGLRGAFVDPRIQAVEQTSDEAGSSAVRAVWNQSTKQFVLAESGAGVKAFIMDEAAAAAVPTQAQRATTMKAVSMNATNAHWIWDSAEGTTPTYTPGTVAADVDRATVEETVSLGQLPAPTITPEGPTVTTLSSFPLSPAINFSKPAGLTSDSFQIVYNDSKGNVGYGAEGAVSVAVSGVTPGSALTAWVRSTDARWTHSSTDTENYDAPTVGLELNLTAPSTVNYFQAGGAPETGSATAPLYALADVPNASQVGNGQRYQIVPSATNSFSRPEGTGGTNTASLQITLSLDSFNNTSPRSIYAKAMALGPLATNTFLNRLTDSVARSASVSIAAYPLSVAPTPASATSITTATTISLAKVSGFPSGQLPASTSIRYTTDGTDPTAASLVYNAAQPISFNEAGNRTLKAMVIPPLGYGPWFTTPIMTATYTVASLQSAAPFGVIVNTATLQNNAVVAGNMVLARDRPVTDFNMIGNSRIKGNLYVPGTPNVFRASRTTPYGQAGYSQYWDMQWRPAAIAGNPPAAATDDLFAPYILGGQFDINGVQTIPAVEAASPRVKDTGGGLSTPTNYSILLQESAKIEGKIIRRYDQYGLGGTITAPTAANNTPGRTYDSWQTSDANPGRITQLDPMSTPGAKVFQQNAASNAGNTTVGAGSKVRFTAGDYKNVTVQENSVMILGDPNNPNVQQNYSFSTLDFNGGGSMQIVGKVVITITQPMVIHNGGTLGDVNHPDWLIIKHYTTGNPPVTAITFTSDSKGYAQILAPKGSVVFENGSLFRGSVTAYDMQLKSDNILFNQSAL